MQKIIAHALILLTVAGCSATPPYSAGDRIEPIPGSITYGGQPRSRLTKAPVGSIVPHEFRNARGERVEETYVIEPDRSLRLVSRQICRLPFCDD